MLMHQRWSYLDGALRSRKYLCLSRALHAMLLHYRGMCPVRVRIRKCSQMRCILPTMPCHVTFNPMAFFPVIRSSRRIKRTFFPFSFTFAIYVCVRAFPPPPFFFKPSQNCVPCFSSLYLSVTLDTPNFQSLFDPLRHPSHLLTQ